MNDEALRVLLVDDEASLRRPLARHLSNMYGYHVDTAANEEEAWERVLRAERPYDVALIDDLLTPKPGVEPEPIGIGLMARIQERCPETGCIVFTGWGMDRALEALQAGAYRYLAKPLNLDELGMTIRMAAEQGRLRRERDLLSATLGISGAMLGELDVQKTLGVIAEAVPTLVGAEACAVALLDHATGKVRHDPIIPLGDATVKWHRHLREVQLTKQITEMGEPFFLSDVAAEAKRVDENLRLAGVKSFAGVPIPGEPQNLGVLYAYSTRREAFGTHERRVLQLLAGQAAIALENARLFADTQKSAQRSEALYRTSHALSSYLEEEPVIRAILDAVYRTLGCEHVLISTVDDEAETIGIRHGIWDGKFDVFPEWIEMSQYSLDHPDILTDIYRTGRTEIIKGWDDRFNREIYDKFGHERFLRIFMPIKTRDEVIGVVEVGYDKREKGHISEDEVQLLAAFMYQAAVALENARLFDTTRRASEQLSALNEVVLEIGKELSQDALLQKVIGQAMTLLSAEGGRVYLLDVTGEHFTLATTAGLSLDLEGQRIGKNEGLTGEILRMRKPQKVADYYCWEKRLRILDAHKLTSVAGAPIRVGDRILGTLVVHDTRPGKQFDDTMLTLLQQFANHAGLALLKAELLERLQAIQQVSTTITSSLESQEVLNCICQAAVELFGVDHSGLVLFDKSLKWGTVEGEYPAQPNTLGTKIPIEGVLAEERLAFNGETLVFSDVEEVVSELGPVLDIWRRLDIRSILVIPITYQNRSLGSFSLDAVGHVRQFTSEEVELCKVFAAHVAVAVENARLFSELVEAKEWREALIEYAFDAVIAIDQDAKITVFNQRAEEMFGWTAEKMIGNTVARLHTDLGKARELSNVVNREGAITDWDVELKHRDGTRIPALLSAVLIRDGQGNPIGQSGFIRDLRQVQLYENRLHALLHVSQAITETLEPEQVLKLVVDSAIAVFPAAQKGSIHLYDEKTGVLHIKASHGYSPEVVKALTLKVGEGRAGWVYEHAIPLVIGNVQEDERSRQVDRKIKYPEVQEQKSAICIPLVVGDQVIGTLSLDNVTTFDAFESEDLGLLSIFASQAAIAIINAELVTKNRERLRKLQMLSRTSNEMMSNLHSLSFDDRLNLIVKHAAQILDAEAGSIFLVKRPGFLTKEACYGHLEKDFQKGREFAIVSGRKTGLTGHIAHTGELFNAHGDGLVGHWAVAGKGSAHVASGKCHSLLAIPLKRRVDGREQLVGLLEVENKKDKDGQPKSQIGFTEEDEWILSIFAETVVICLENAELYERTSDRLEEKVVSLRAIQETSAAISAELGLDDLLDSITEKAAMVFAAPAASLMLWDDAEENLLVRAKHGLTDEYTQQRIPRERVDAAIARMGGLRPLATVDLRSTPFGRADLIEAEHLCSVLSAPLAVSGRLIGILNIYSKDEPRQFTPDEIEVAEVFANQAAVAIRNAQLYERLQKRATALRALYEAGQTMTSTLSLPEILNRIAEQVCQLAGRYGKPVRFSHLGLVEGNKLKFIAAHPPKHLPGLQREVGDIDLEYDERIGVIGRAAKTGQSQLVGDVTQDSDYIEYDPETRSELAVPIKVGEQIIGIISVEHSEHDAFDEMDRRALEALAAQAAIAIQNARSYQAEQQRVKELAGLDSISQSIRSLTSIHEVYQQVNESIAQLVGAQMCAVLLYNEVEEALVCQLPMYGVPDEFGRRYRIPVNRGSPMGFLWETRDSLIINGVEQHPLVAELGLKELAKDAGLRDTVLIKLTVGNRNIGVIQASNKCDGKSFDENDDRLLCIFATQAAAVIENARLYEELKQMYEELKHTKGLIGARTALAWMGMVSSEWRHRIRNQAQTIQEQIQHLRKDFRQAPKHDHHIAVDDRLSMIERLTVQIQERPIVPPLSAEEGVTLFAPNDLIGERAKQLWKNDPYRRAELRLNLRLSNTATVKASPEWLRRAFDILVDNAVEAVAGCERRQITVTTRPADEGAEIAVSDTGGGIPPEVMSWLFERQVQRPERAEGFGIGLLIAQAIVQTYGGDIWVESTGPTGTTMVVLLPLVTGNGAEGSIRVS